MKKNNKCITTSIVATSLATIGVISYKVLKKKYPAKLNVINKYIKNNILSFKNNNIEEDIYTKPLKSNKIKEKEIITTIEEYKNNEVEKNINNNLEIDNSMNYDFDNSILEENDFEDKAKQTIQKCLDDIIKDNEEDILIPDDYIEDEIRYQLCLSNKEPITKNILNKLERIDFFEIDDNDIKVYCEFLSKYTNIKSIVIDSLNPLKYDGKIENSSSKYCLKDISPINKLKFLEELSFNWGIEKIDFSTLKDLDKLKKLEIKFGMLNDITFISHLNNLEHIEIMLSNNVKDLSPIAQLENLKILYLYTNIKLDMEIFKNMKSLKKIYINGESITI
ncbi:hypothetical protein [[Clostridium] colinum]|uniref:hypothetical protein n=1 Tax=[Clostridium] colinum TaxID=36835 RepID=UPI002025569D|nr:hypothetical protein [[Clostridium] colinum]